MKNTRIFPKNYVVLCAVLLVSSAVWIGIRSVGMDIKQPTSLLDKGACTLIFAVPLSAVIRLFVIGGYRLIAKLRTALRDHAAMQAIRGNHGDIYLLSVSTSDGRVFDAYANQNKRTLSTEADPAAAV